MMLDGVLNQFRIGFQTEGFHDPVFVKGDSTRFHIQNSCHFLHRLAFRKQLQNLALPPSDSLFCNILMTASQQEVHRFFGNEWTNSAAAEVFTT